MAGLGRRARPAEHGPGGLRRGCALALGSPQTIIPPAIDHGLARTFIHAARRYWHAVFPRVRLELRGWHRRAGVIPDSRLRGHALTVQSSKASNIEGAAAFAAFATCTHGQLVVRAQVCFQAIYDYVDSVAESQRRAPALNARQLHLALLGAVDRAHSGVDHYAHSESSEDAGYVQALVDSCVTAMETLPSRGAVAREAVCFAQRIVAYQTLNLAADQGTQRGLARWAARRTPPGCGLRWWEVAASAGSSLGVFALIALASHRPLARAEAIAVQDAYFPWIGSLHSLLDSLVDRAEDAAAGQANLVAHYESLEQASERVATIAREAARHAGELPHASWHTVVLGGMVGSYLSKPEASAPAARSLRDRVIETVGGAAPAAMAVFQVRRLAIRTVKMCTMPTVP